MLNAEICVHLGVQGVQEAGIRRNGSSRKTVLGDGGELKLSIPRDRGEVRERVFEYIKKIYHRQRRCHSLRLSEPGRLRKRSGFCSQSVSVGSGGSADDRFPSGFVRVSHGKSQHSPVVRSDRRCLLASDWSKWSC